MQNIGSFSINVEISVIVILVAKLHGLLTCSPITVRGVLHQTVGSYKFRVCCYGTIVKLHTSIPVWCAVDRPAAATLLYILIADSILSSKLAILNLCSHRLFSQLRLAFE
jgi:hypothetical protein